MQKSHPKIQRYTYTTILSYANFHRLRKVEIADMNTILLLTISVVCAMQVIATDGMCFTITVLSRHNNSFLMFSEHVVGLVL